MERETLMIGAQSQPAFQLRKMWQLVKAFRFFFLILSSILLVIAFCEPCSTNWMVKPAESGGCQVYGDDHLVKFQCVLLDDASAGLHTRIQEGHKSLHKVCPDHQSFCFLSTLVGLFPEKNVPKAAVLDVSRIQTDTTSFSGSIETGEEQSGRNLSGGYGVFKLSNGQAVSCSLHQRNGVGEFSSSCVAGANENDLSSCGGSLLVQTRTDFALNNSRGVTSSDFFGISPSVGVQISTPVLDWGQNYIHLPSVACLRVANTCNRSILHVYEPFSSNSQFFPCNYSETVLKPGEEASVCFVFLPRWSGVSLAHLILQTSSGGFLVQAKGFAIESPYRIQPLASIDVPSSGKVSKNLSLFNHFDDSIHVEEVKAWISISAGSITRFAEALCTVDHSQSWKQYSLLSAGDWLVMKSNLVGFPSIAMKPWKNWEVFSHAGENIMEMDLSFEAEGQISGAFSVKLHRSSQDKYDILTIPLEVSMEKKPTYDDSGDSLSLALEALELYDGNESAVAVTLTNKGPSMLSVVKIIEVADLNILCIKCMAGLLLFPGTSTQVAVIRCCALPVEVNDSPDIDNKCKLLVLTNNSVSPHVTIPCNDIVHICLKSKKVSSVGYWHQSEWDRQRIMRIERLSHDMQLKSWNEVFGSREADELILHNWKSLSTSSGITLLEDTELLFPMVSTGSNHSEWITVRNPTKHSVAMQLILNSGEIVDECRGQDGSMHSIFSSNLAYNGSSSTKSGFSLAENALTEAYVYPYSQASFGPIVFHPFGRCRWSSSVLIRNNLSGVEWLSIQGLGGSLSLVLFEDSEPIIHGLEFNLNLPIPSAVSLVDFFLKVEETTYGCSQKMSKELFAENTGDLPVEVSSIEISGAECQLGGFMVHNCRGFSLLPGESTRLLISYQSDFCAAIVDKDLELAFASGSLVIPMKAAVPVHMLNICKRSLIWMRLKKFFFILLFGSILLLVFCLILSQVMALEAQYLGKTWRRPFFKISNKEKSSHLPHTHGNDKYASPSETGSLLGSITEDNLLKPVQEARHAIGDYRPPTSGSASQDAKLSLGNDKPMARLDTRMESFSFPSLPKSSTALNLNLAEASVVPDAVETSVNLSVRTRKEKGKRRRKRKGMAAGSVEVSSSQSGNSTPSSPLSPMCSIMPNRARSGSPDTGRFVEAGNSFSQSTGRTSTTDVLEHKLSAGNISESRQLRVHRQSSVLSTSVGRPILSPSATFPSACKVLGSSPLASKSAVAPHARAPGSKLIDQKAVKQEGNIKLRDEYTYDIWGDHLSGLYFKGRPEDDVACKSSAAESESFFVSGPQTRVTKSQSRSVSYLCENG